MKLLDIQTTADFLGTSRQTISRMIEAGSLVAIPIRTGKRKRVLRIPDSSLKKFLGIPKGEQLVIEPALIKQKKEPPEATEEPGALELHVV